MKVQAKNLIKGDRLLNGWTIQNIGEVPGRQFQVELTKGQDFARVTFSGTKKIAIRRAK